MSRNPCNSPAACASPARCAAADACPIHRPRLVVPTQPGQHLTRVQIARNIIRRRRIEPRRTPSPPPHRRRRPRSPSPGRNAGTRRLGPAQHLFQPLSARLRCHVQSSALRRFLRRFPDLFLPRPRARGNTRASGAARTAGSPPSLAPSSPPIADPAGSRIAAGSPFSERGARPIPGCDPPSRRESLVPTVSA